MTVGILCIGLLLVLIFLRLPIAFAMALIGAGGMLVLNGPRAAMGIMTQTTSEVAAASNLAVLPLFVLMGSLVTHSGMSQGLYRAAHAMVGHFRGGLAMATVLACGGFSTICGSSLATAATALLQPLLVRRMGQLQAVLLVQACSLPFLAVLGFAPQLWMVTAALFTRGALMNAAGPVYSAYAMTALPEEDRPMYSAVNLIAWDLGWAISSILSGVVRGALPFTTAFNALFAWTLLMYAASVLAIYLGLYRRAQRTPTPAPVTP